MSIVWRLIRFRISWLDAQCKVGYNNSQGDTNGLIADTIRILVTTDNHVGYYETDPIRGDDAWKTFDEILQLAKDRDVDMILCAGDLFHVNKPSKKSYYEVIRSLRKHCLGDKPVELEMLFDGPLKRNSQDSGFAAVNYEDPNINVAIPFFSISGNHDDVSGVSLLAAMDVLEATGYVNYFGKVLENDNISVDPILLKKGETKLALYGFDSVRDERLFRTFRAGKVRFSRPATNEDDYFNLIAVHQNHTAHTPTGYLRESFIPDFMDLVVWGHEHDSHPDPVWNATQGFQVLQPGSSVATSLTQGESLPKHAVILNITGKKLFIERIPLLTVRPFAYETVELSEAPINTNERDIKSQITRWMIKKVESLISKARIEWEILHPDSPLEDFPLPLIRLRVEHRNQHPLENPLRFSGRFAGRVANVGDVVQYLQKKTTKLRNTKSHMDLNETVILSEDEDMLSGLKVQDLVKDELEKENLDLLQSKELTEAIGSYVEKDDRTILKEFVKKTMNSEVEKMKKQNDLTTAELLGRLHLDEEPPDTKKPAKSKALNTVIDRVVASGRGKAQVSARARTSAKKARTAKNRVPEKLFVSDGEDEEELELSPEEDNDEDVIMSSDRDSPSPPKPTTKRTKALASKKSEEESATAEIPPSRSTTRTAPTRGRGRGGRRVARV